MNFTKIQIIFVKKIVMKCNVMEKNYIEDKSYIIKSAIYCLDVKNHSLFIVYYFFNKKVGSDT